MKIVIHIFCLILTCAACQAQLEIGTSEAEKVAAEKISALRKQADRLNNSMPVEPGKCYEKCRILDSYDIAHESFYEYTGINPVQKGVELRKIIVSPARNQWIKRKKGPRDGCCMSADQICYVWALKEVIPAQVIAINVVTDTSHIKEFQLRNVITKTWKDINLIEWREVICESDPEYDLIIKRILVALNERGYDTSPPNYDFDYHSKIALANFQRENSLPLGHLDLETLAALEIF